MCSLSAVVCCVCEQSQTSAVLMGFVAKNLQSLLFWALIRWVQYSPGPWRAPWGDWNKASIALYSMIMIVSLFAVRRERGRLRTVRTRRMVSDMSSYSPLAHIHIWINSSPSFFKLPATISVFDHFPKTFMALRIFCCMIIWTCNISNDVGTDGLMGSADM